VGYKFAVKPQTAENGDAPSAVLPKEGGPLSPSGQGIASRSEPERRQLTVLSCMLVGFAALAVSLDPEDLAGIAQRFQEICTTVITNWGGTVVNFVGDELLALFGYPKSHEDDAERAVQAGLDLAAKVGDLLSPSGEPLQVRTAIATGVALINDDQTAVGEAIVTAARLRSAGPADSVIIAASTSKLLGTVFVYENAERCEFGGDSGPVTAYRVVGKRAIESRFVARRTGKLTQFAGRQAELQQMSALWQQAKNGKGQVALVCGEAGIGKSRVCE